MIEQTRTAETAPPPDIETPAPPGTDLDIAPDACEEDFTPYRKGFADRLRKSRIGRTAILIAVALTFFLGVVFFTGGRKSSTKVHEATPEASQLLPSADSFEETLTTAEELRALFTKYGERLDQNEGGLGALKNEVGKTQDLLEELLGKEKNREGRLGEMMESVRRMLDPETVTVPPLGPDGGGGRSSASPPANLSLRVIAFEQGDTKRPEPAGKVLVIPSASAGEATVLTGTFAPVTGEPSPIRLRLDAAIVGPNRSRVPLRGAFLHGKAQGDANTERVIVELTRLSYVGAGGRLLDLPVRGYVVGRDRSYGIPGDYIYRIEDQLPLAAIASGASGLADGFAEREIASNLNPLGGVSRIFTGNPARYAGLKAASGTSEKIEEIVAERLAEIRPVVSAPADAVVEVVFLDPVVLEDLDMEEAPHVSKNPYVGLDLHR